MVSYYLPVIIPIERSKKLHFKRKTMLNSPLVDQLRVRRCSPDSIQRSSSGGCCGHNPGQRRSTRGAAGGVLQGNRQAGDRWSACDPWRGDGDVGRAAEDTEGESWRGEDNEGLVEMTKIRICKRASQKPILAFT